MRIAALASLLMCLPLTLWPGMASAGGVSSQAASAAAHDAAPSFQLPAVQGTVDSDSLRGHLVLVDFWASWCGPCAQSFPWLGSVQKRYEAKGLRVVAINLDKKREAAERFLLKHGAPFTVAFDPEGKTAEAFQVESMPSSYLIGPDGTILYTKHGFRADHTQEIESKIEEACR